MHEKQESMGKRRVLCFIHALMTFFSYGFYPYRPYENAPTHWKYDVQDRASASIYTPRVFDNDQNVC